MRQISHHFLSIDIIGHGLADDGSRFWLHAAPSGHTVLIENDKPSNSKMIEVKPRVNQGASVSLLVTIELKEILESISRSRSIKYKVLWRGETTYKCDKAFLDARYPEKDSSSSVSAQAGHPELSPNGQKESRKMICS